MATSTLDQRHGNKALACMDFMKPLGSPVHRARITPSPQQYEADHSIMKTLKILATPVLLAVIVSGLAPSSASAQEYKEVYNAAVEAAKAKDYQAALNEFTRAADLASEAGDTEVANRAADTAAKIQYNLGTRSIRQEEFQTALNHFNAGIALYPRYPKNYMGKALALKKLGQTEEAIQAYLELIQFGNDNNDTEAIRSGEKGIREHYIFLASSALSRRDQPSASDAREAIAHLEQLLELVESDADAYYYLSAANNALGNYDEAVSLADQALAIHRGSRTDAAKIHFLKGEALMYSGEITAAKEAFENAKFGNYKSLAEHYLETL